MLLSTIPMEHAGIMVRRPVFGTAINGGVDEYCEKLRNTMASNVTDLLVKLDYDDVQVGTQGIAFRYDESRRTFEGI